MTQNNHNPLASLVVRLCIREGTAADGIEEALDVLDFAQYMRRAAQSYLFSQGGALSGVIVEVESGD